MQKIFATWGDDRPIAEQLEQVLSQRRERIIQRYPHPDPLDSYLDDLRSRTGLQRHSLRQMMVEAGVGEDVDRLMHDTVHNSRSVYSNTVFLIEDADGILDGLKNGVHDLNRHIGPYRLGRAGVFSYGPEKLTATYCVLTEPVNPADFFTPQAGAPLPAPFDNRHAVHIIDKRLMHLLNASPIGRAMQHLLAGTTASDTHDYLHSLIDIDETRPEGFRQAMQENLVTTNPHTGRETAVYGSEAHASVVHAMVLQRVEDIPRAVRTPDSEAEQIVAAPPHASRRDRFSLRDLVTSCMAAGLETPAFHAARPDRTDPSTRHSKRVSLNHLH